MLILEDKVKTNRTAFVQKVARIATLLGIEPNWLMAVMFFESGLNEKAMNASTNATGLIQFMPKTAIGLKTSVNALYSMNNINQLDFVYAYYKPKSGKLKSLVDLYLCTFFPLAIGQPDTYVLKSKDISAGSIAKVNKIFDPNGDKQVTVGEIKAALKIKFSKTIGDKNTNSLFSVVLEKAKTKTGIGLIAVTFFGTAIISYILLKNKRLKQKK